MKPWRQGVPLLHRFDSGDLKKIVYVFFKTKYFIKFRKEFQ